MLNLIIADATRTGLPLSVAVTVAEYCEVVALLNTVPLATVIKPVVELISNCGAPGNILQNHILQNHSK
jgi:hypothetical protein